MNINIDGLIDSYYKWLKDKTAWKQLKNDWVQITTPYLDRHNDYIQIYLKQDGADSLLSDDSYTLEDLELSGCKLDSPKRQKLLEMTLNGFGVHKKAEEIFIKTTHQNFALNKHNLVQAILAVNDMFYLAQPNVTNLFFEDVQAWLEQSDIRFLERVPFIGRSGYTRHFDFVIPKSRSAPERMIQTVNNPNKHKAEELAFGWLDTKEARASDAKAYAFVNDNERIVPESFQDALKSYDIIPISWSNRSAFAHVLAA